MFAVTSLASLYIQWWRSVGTPAWLDLRSPMSCHSHSSLSTPPLNDTLITSHSSGSPTHTALTSNSHYLSDLVNFISKRLLISIFTSTTLLWSLSLVGTVAVVPTTGVPASGFTCYNLFYAPVPESSFENEGLFMMPSSLKPFNFLHDLYDDIWTINVHVKIFKTSL